MHLTNTDLPVPEPPMMTRLSPLSQSISSPSSTRLLPNDLRSPRTEIFGTEASVIARRPSTPEKGRGNQVIEYEDHDRSGNHGIGWCLPNALCSTPRVVAVVASHQRDDTAERRRLHQTRDHVSRLQVLVSAVEVSLRIEAEPVDANEISAKDADDIGDEDQHRQGNQPGDQTRQQQITHGV